MDNQLFEILLNTLRDHWVGLKDKPDETPEVTLSALWLVAQDFEQHLLPRINGNDFEQRIRFLVSERLAGVPLAYLTGVQRYMGVELLASPGAMIPRKETEILGETVFKKAALLSEQHDTFQALDLCTGSGNVILAAAYNFAALRGYGADITPAAVELAEKNARHLKLSERVQFVVSDMFAAFPVATYAGSFQLITCNPPYISSAQVERMPDEIQKFEPREAFDGGPFGIRIINRLYREAPAYLSSGGWLCFEVGLGQGEALKKSVERSGLYAIIESYTDAEGSIRVLALQKP